MSVPGLSLSRRPNPGTRLATRRGKPLALFGRVFWLRLFRGRSGNRSGLTVNEKTVEQASKRNSKHPFSCRIYSLERHTRVVEPGRVIFFNRDKVNCDSSLLRESGQCLGLPISELLKLFGRVLPVMQNSVMYAGPCSIGSTWILKSPKRG